VLLAGSWGNRAAADTFQLLGTANSTPAAVNLSGSIASGGALSDILQWEDLSGVKNTPYASQTASAPLSSGLDFQTYCVDVLHDIGIGGTYSLAVGTISSASSGAGWGSGVQTAVQYLFGSNNSGLKPVPPGGIGTGFNGTTAQTDGDFQAALWATIYDYSALSALSAAPSNLNLGPLAIANYGGGYLGITSNAAAMAWGAVQDSLGGSHLQAGANQNTSLDAMYLTNTSTGQQQVFITSAAALASTPLPHAYAGGLVLFGLVGVVTRARRAKGLGVS
jgi:hypothetical protein